MIQIFIHWRAAIDMAKRRMAVKPLVNRYTLKMEFLLELDALS